MISMVAMNRSQTIKLLEASKEALGTLFGVTRLVLLGSLARGAARDDSDVDIRVDFAGPATSRQYFGVLFYLEDLFGRPVDLVTEKTLRAELRPYTERDAIHV